MNVNIIYHKYETWLIISTRNRMERGDLEEGRRRQREEDGLLKNNLYYAHVPTPQDDCKLHVRQIYSN